MNTIAEPGEGTLIATPQNPMIFRYAGPLNWSRLRAKVLAFTILVGVPTQLRLSGRWFRRGSGLSVAIHEHDPRRVSAMAAGMLQVVLSPLESTLVAPEDIIDAVYEFSHAPPGGAPQTTLVDAWPGR